MPLGDFVEAGTFPKPLRIGRTGRLLIGVGTLFYFAWLVAHYDALVGTTLPDWGWWIGVFFAFYYFPDLVVVGF